MKAEMEEFVTAVLSGMDRAMDRLEARISLKFDARFIPLEEKVNRIDANVSEMREELDAALKAIDHDAVQLIDHGRRIEILEGKLA